MSDIRIVTISREYGSGGGPIGKIVAGHLGWRLVDDNLVGEIARRGGVSPDVAARFDERVDPWFHRLVKAIWQGGYEGVATDPGRGVFDADAMAELWHRVIAESAEIGCCVIVGRGGQCLLRGRHDAFHVSVHAPLAWKERLLREMGAVAPGADLRALTEETDRRRAAYVRRYFGEDWTARHLYHLVISGTVGLERAAQAILVAAGLTAEAPGRGDQPDNRSA